MNRKITNHNRAAAARFGTAKQHGLLGPSESSALADHAMNAWDNVLVVLDDMMYVRFDAHDNLLPPATSTDLAYAVHLAEAATAAAGIRV